VAAAVVVSACHGHIEVKLPADGEIDCQLHPRHPPVWRHWRYDDDDVLDERVEP
jgi:hypothetical protein